MTPNSNFMRLFPLGDGDQPVQKIRCPIHGFIHYSANERRIIDHPIFRRLRSIRQLALTEYVYPGATHTRFEHSLGVMEVATRAFESLCSRHGGDLCEHYGRYPYFRDRPLDRARQILRLTALLHDIGHAPFSHAAEPVIQKDGRHEALSIKIVESDELEGGGGGLRSLLEKTWGEGTAATVAALINEQCPPHLSVLKQLISGEIDADRMDYLLRDSHHCGVDYGRFDHRRLIECLAISFDGETMIPNERIPQIALSEGGLYAYEALILARFQMNVQVYYHRVRRIYDHYLKEYFKAIGPTVFPSHTALLQENDFTMLTRIQKDAENPSAAGHMWARRIATRQHHAKVYEGGTLEWNAEGADREKRFIKRYDKLREAFPDIDFIFDACEERKPISLHKLVQRSDTQEEEQAPERRMKMIREGRSDALLGFESLILGKVPRRFKLPRIFADVRGLPERRAAIEAKVQELYEGD